MHPSIYFFLGFLVFVLFFLIPGLSKRKRKAKKLQQFREQWGSILPDVYRNFYLISQFADLQEKTGTLPTQTLADIDFDDVFSFLDRTGSCVGQQYLYYRLKNPLNDVVALNDIDTQVNYFTDNAAIREEIQLLVDPLQKQDAHYISSLLNDKLFIPPKWYPLLKIDTVIVVLMLILSFKFHVLLIWMLLPLAINTGLHLWNKNNTSQFIRSFPQLNILINISRTLSGKKDLPFNAEAVVKSAANLKAFQKRFGLLNFSNGYVDEFSQAFLFAFEVLKAVFLVEVHSFMRCIDELRTKKQDVIHLFSYVGSIDAAIAIASVRKGCPEYCRPDFSNPAKTFDLQNAYHPLIEGCVKNSLVINGKSILITGSNMSGKTTFIRTVAINTILAQTIYTCFAEKYTAPLLQILSSIRMDDDVLEGKSFYLAEVEAIHTLIKASETGKQHLFILDEVFKGTNTVERIAAAKAILSYLNRHGNMVLVSTHDLELADLLQNEYDLYHFEEQVANNELFFDHRIKEGRLTKRNAISLLEIYGYPQSVITEARLIAGT